MLPPNAIPKINRLLIEDYLRHDHCHRAERELKVHFAAYDSDSEISHLARDMEHHMSTLLEDCVLLVAAAALRPSMIKFIQERVDVPVYVADCIRARAELKWLNQCSGMDADEAA